MVKYIPIYILYAYNVSSEFDINIRNAQHSATAEKLQEKKSWKKVDMRSIHTYFVDNLPSAYNSDVQSLISNILQVFEGLTSMSAWETRTGDALINKLCLPSFDVLVMWYDSVTYQHGDVRAAYICT